MITIYIYWDKTAAVMPHAMVMPRTTVDEDDLNYNNKVIHMNT